jgi:hypothetical protein
MILLQQQDDENSDGREKSPICQQTDGLANSPNGDQESANDNADDHKHDDEMSSRTALAHNGCKLHAPMVIHGND